MTGYQEIGDLKDLLYDSCSHRGYMTMFGL